MATAFKLVANPSTVTAGGTSMIDVTCTLNPGGPVDVHLSIGGVTVLANATVTVPPEAFPNIKLAGDPTITPTDYVLSTSQGTLTKQSDGVYTLQF